MRLIAVLAFFVMFTTPAASDAAWPDKTWPTATPESEGIEAHGFAQESELRRFVDGSNRLVIGDLGDAGKER